MFLDFLIVLGIVLTISLIYLMFRPAAKPVRWLMVITGAIVTVLIVPFIVVMIGFAWEIGVQAPKEQEQFQEDFGKAESVANALSEFYSSNGYYPVELSDLVPDYLNHLPSEPYTGKPYEYFLHERGEFIFVFRGWSGRVGFDMYCYFRDGDVQCSYVD